MMTRLAGAFGLVLATALSAGADDGGLGDLAARRAFRAAVAAGGEKAKAAVAAGLKSPDPFVRRGAVWEWYVRNGAADQAALEAFLVKMGTDPSDEVVSAVVDLSKALKDAERRNRLLMGLLATARGEFQKKYVAAAFQFPFQRDNVALSADPGNDHLMVKAWEFKLPQEGWRFKTDPSLNGHLPPQEWFKPDFVPGDGWLTVKVPLYFEHYDESVANYDGVVWYVVDFDLPAKPDVGKGKDVISYELAFGAVDEEAWVWLNGEYVGQHCEGPGGWNRPFRLDVQRELKWGAKNRLVVRVSDTTEGGGIHKPVTVEVMK